MVVDFSAWDTKKRPSMWHEGRMHDHDQCTCFMSGLCHHISSSYGSRKSEVSNQQSASGVIIIIAICARARVQGRTRTSLCVSASVTLRRVQVCVRVEECPCTGHAWAGLYTVLARAGGCAARLLGAVAKLGDRAARRAPRSSSAPHGSRPHPLAPTTGDVAT